MMLVHHDDAECEYEYGVQSHSGTFSDSPMADSAKNGWTVISKKDDWNRVSGSTGRRIDFIACAKPGCSRRTALLTLSDSYGVIRSSHGER